MATSAVQRGALERTFVTPEGVDLRLELGSAGSRAAAFMIDLMFMIGALVAMTLSVLLLTWRWTKSGPPEGAMEFFRVLWLIGFFILRHGWFSLFEMGSRGATAGK